MHRAGSTGRGGSASVLQSAAVRRCGGPNGRRCAGPSAAPGGGGGDAVIDADPVCFPRGIAAAAAEAAAAGLGEAGSAVTLGAVDIAASVEALHQSARLTCVVAAVYQGEEREDRGVGVRRWRPGTAGAKHTRVPLREARPALLRGRGGYVVWLKAGHPPGRTCATPRYEKYKGGGAWVWKAKRSSVKEGGREWWLRGWERLSGPWGPLEGSCCFDGCSLF